MSIPTTNMEELSNNKRNIPLHTKDKTMVNGRLIPHLLLPPPSQRREEEETASCSLEEKRKALPTDRRADSRVSDKQRCQQGDNCTQSNTEDFTGLRETLFVRPHHESSITNKGRWTNQWVAAGGGPSKIGPASHAPSPQSTALASPLESSSAIRVRNSSIVQSRISNAGSRLDRVPGE